MTLEQAVDRAYKTAADYQAALERVRAAEAAREAALGEGLPVGARRPRITASWALSIRDSHSTYAIAGAVDVPIFQGGQTRGRLLEADADLRSRRAEAEDLKAAIYYEVRTAFLDLQAGTEQLQVAARARELAAQQLTQARDRFAAGVASNIEVVQAQEAVALANEQYIAALYATNLAKGRWSASRRHRRRRRAPDFRRHSLMADQPASLVVYRLAPDRTRGRRSRSFWSSASAPGT